MGVSLTRQKGRSLLVSVIYRMIKLPFPDRFKLKLFLNLEWIFERLAHEVSYKVYDSDKHPLREAGVSFIVDFIEPEYSVLDLGCSRGEITRRIGEKAKFVVGIDHSAEAIALAKPFARNHVEFHCGDAREFLRTNDRRFDVLILSHILEHLDEPEKFLDEFKGYFRFVYIEVPDFDRTIFNHIRKDLSVPLIYTDADHVNEFDRSEINQILERCDLKVLRSEFIFGVQRYWCGTS